MFIQFFQLNSAKIVEFVDDSVIKSVHFTQVFEGVLAPNGSDNRGSHCTEL